MILSIEFLLWIILTWFFILFAIFVIKFEIEVGRINNYLANVGKKNRKRNYQIFLVRFFRERIKFFLIKGSFRFAKFSLSLRMVEMIAIEKWYFFGKQKDSRKIWIEKLRAIQNHLEGTSYRSFMICESLLRMRKISGTREILQGHCWISSRGT